MSIHAYAQIVGNADFNGRLPGWAVTHVDALQILVTPLDGLAGYLADRRDDPEQIGAPGRAHWELGGGRVHKAGFSGGPAYGVLVPDDAADTADTAWCYDDLHPDATFVGYLRQTIGDCCLPGWRRRPHERPHPAVLELSDGLIPF